MKKNLLTQTPEEVLESLLELNGETSRVLQEPIISKEFYNSNSIYDEEWNAVDEDETKGVGVSFERLSKYHSDRLNERYYGTIAFFGGLDRQENRQESESFSITNIDTESNTWELSKWVIQVDSTTLISSKQYLTKAEALAINALEDKAIYADYIIDGETIVVVDLSQEKQDYILSNPSINSETYTIVPDGYLWYLKLATITYTGNSNGISLFTDDDINMLKRAIVRAIDIDRYVKRPQFLNLAVPNLSFTGTNNWGLETQQFNAVRSYTEDVQKLINGSSLRAVSKDPKKIIDVWLKMIGAESTIFLTKSETEELVRSLIDTNIYDRLTSLETDVDVLKKKYEEIYDAFLSGDIDSRFKTLVNGDKIQTSNTEIEFFSPAYMTPYPKLLDESNLYELFKFIDIDEFDPITANKKSIYFGKDGADFGQTFGDGSSVALQETRAEDIVSVEDIRIYNQIQKPVNRIYKETSNSSISVQNGWELGFNVQNGTNWNIADGSLEWVFTGRVDSLNVPIFGLKLATNSSIGSFGVKGNLRFLFGGLSGNDGGTIIFRQYANETDFLAGTNQVGLDIQIGSLALTDRLDNTQKDVDIDRMDLQPIAGEVWLVPLIIVNGNYPVQLLGKTGVASQLISYYSYIELITGTEIYTEGEN